MRFFSRIIQKMIDENIPLEKRKRIILIVSLLTLLSMTSATVAWFTVNTFAGVDDLDLSISVSAQLKVSMEDHGTDLTQYTDTITNEMVNEYLRTQNTSLEDILLDPVTTTDGVRFVNQRGVERVANNRSYLEFECYFIATEDMWVHLTTESTEAGNDDGTKVTTTSTGLKAEVVECTRVGFTTADNGTAIYEPYKGAPVNGQSTFDLPTGAMEYSNSTRLFHLEEMTPTKATIRIWVDGEDPQCDDDVQDAQLTVQLGFIGCDDDNVPIA